MTDEYSTFPNFIIFGLQVELVAKACFLINWMLTVDE